MTSKLYAQTLRKTKSRQKINMFAHNLFYFLNTKLLTV